uniref:Chemosensory protein n=1 Tax=Blattella germanica TaxID=6973 RepID=A0A0X8DBH6_BLAGE|nr:chemosensory protein [Blattella germanica]
MELQMKLCLGLALFTTIAAESTQSFKDGVEPHLKKCMEKVVDATEDDFNAVYNRNPLETHSARCLLKCLYGELDALLPDGRIKSGDDLMPIMEKLYGFKEFKTVMRTQIVNQCVDMVNSGEARDCELASDLIHCVMQHY